MRSHVVNSLGGFGGRLPLAFGGLQSGICGLGGLLTQGGRGHYLPWRRGFWPRVSTHRATRWWSSSSTQCGEDSVQRDANAPTPCYETRCSRRRRRRPLKRLSRQHKNTRPTSPPRRRRRRMAEPCASGALACSVETIARCTLRATRWWGGRRLSAM